MKVRLTALETVAMTALVIALAFVIAVTSCPTGNRQAAAWRHIADADSVAAVIGARKAAHADSSVTKTVAKKRSEPKKRSASKATSRNYLDEPVNK